jgi:hypothetical protein
MGLSEVRGVVAVKKRMTKADRPVRAEPVEALPFSGASVKRGLRQAQPERMLAS